MKPLHSNKAPASNGDPASNNGHGTDVLERPQTAKKGKHHRDQDTTMTDTHRLLQAILDNVPDRIYFKDTQSRFIRLSKSLARRLGVDDPALALGKTDFDFNPSENAREYFQDEQRVMDTGEP